jgi:DNA helicase-2/ATP-dependent DNA helicase PcrA
MLHGQTRYHLKSRFFDELPEAALKWITPKNQGFGSGYGQGSRQGGATSGGRSDWAANAFAARSQSVERFASPPVPAQRDAPAHGLTSGVNVFHAKFGEGKVLRLEGTGDDARAQIDFTRHGVKWLALSVAKLTVV